MPAMMGVVPLVVDRSRLQQANALLSFSRCGLSVIGPAIAGLLVVGVGPGWALAVDALTYAVAIVCLTRVGLPRSRRRPRTSPLDVPRAAGGVAEFTPREWLWVIVLVFGMTNAIHAGVIGVLGPLVAKTTPADRGGRVGPRAQRRGRRHRLMTLVMLRLQLDDRFAPGCSPRVLAVPMALLGLRPRWFPWPSASSWRGRRSRYSAWVEHRPARAHPRGGALARVELRRARLLRRHPDRHLPLRLARDPGRARRSWFVSDGVYVVISLSRCFAVGARARPQRVRGARAIGRTGARVPPGPARAEARRVLARP